MTDRYVNPDIGSSSNDGSANDAANAYASIADVIANDKGVSDVLNIYLYGGTDALGSALTVIAGFSATKINIYVMSATYRMTKTAGWQDVIEFNDTSVPIEKHPGLPLVVEHLGSMSAGRGVVTCEGVDVTLDGVHIIASGGGTGNGLYVKGGTTVAKNIYIPEGVGADGITATFVVSSPTMTVHNASVANCGGDGISDAGSAMHLYDCASMNNTGNDYDGAINTLVNCASSDLTGSAGKQSIGWNTTNFTNVTGGSVDMRLPSGSALEGAGSASPPATAPLNDFDEVAYAATRSIGCFEVPSVGGGDASGASGIRAAVRVSASGSKQTGAAGQIVARGSVDSGATKSTDGSGEITSAAGAQVGGVKAAAGDGRAAARGSARSGGIKSALGQGILRVANRTGVSSTRTSSGTGTIRQRIAQSVSGSKVANNVAQILARVFLRSSSEKYSKAQIRLAARVIASGSKSTGGSGRALSRAFARMSSVVRGFGRIAIRAFNRVAGTRIGLGSSEASSRASTSVTGRKASPGPSQPQLRARTSARGTKVASGHGQIIVRARDLVGGSSTRQGHGQIIAQVRLQTGGAEPPLIGEKIVAIDCPFHDGRVALCSGVNTVVELVS